MHKLCTVVCFFSHVCVTLLVFSILSPIHGNSFSFSLSKFKKLFNVQVKRRTKGFFSFKTGSQHTKGTSWSSTWGYSRPTDYLNFFSLCKSSVEDADDSQEESMMDQREHQDQESSQQTHTHSPESRASLAWKVFQTLHTLQKQMAQEQTESSLDYETQQEVCALANKEAQGKRGGGSLLNLVFARRLLLFGERVSSLPRLQRERRPLTSLRQLLCSDQHWLLSTTHWFNSDFSTTKKKDKGNKKRVFIIRSTSNVIILWRRHEDPEDDDNDRDTLTRHLRQRCRLLRQDRHVSAWSHTDISYLHVSWMIPHLPETLLTSADYKRERKHTILIGDNFQQIKTVIKSVSHV